MDPQQAEQAEYAQGQVKRASAAISTRMSNQELTFLLEKRKKETEKILEGVDKKLKILLCNEKENGRRLGDHDSNLDIDREVLTERRNFHLGIITGIEYALERINQGEGGICVKCKNPISKKRLIAAPETPLCFSCKQKQSKMAMVH